MRNVVTGMIEAPCLGTKALTHPLATFRVCLWAIGGGLFRRGSIHPMMLWCATFVPLPSFHPQVSHASPQSPEVSYALVSTLSRSVNLDTESMWVLAQIPKWEHL